MKDKDFDEMQMQRRNSIGYQMFKIMTCLIFLNKAFYLYGVTWIGYPMNILAIVLACWSVYVIRLIGANAYPPTSGQSSTIRLLIRHIIVPVSSMAIAMAVATVTIFGQSLGDLAGIFNDYRTIVIMAIYAAGFIIAPTVAIVKKARTKNDNEA